MLFENSEIEKKDKLLNIFLKSISKDNEPQDTSSVINDFSKNIVPYINDTRYKRRIKILRKLYFNTGYRHSYSIISSYLTSSKKDINLANIADNMAVILKRLLDNYNECLLTEVDKEKYSEFIEIVFKLNDHISLEAIRLNDLLLTEKNLSDNTIRAKTDIDNKAKAINNQLKKNSDEIKNELNGELKKTRSEYITILGIFASIIIAFVAGLTFSTSVLTNIDKASVYRLAFIVCLIGLFVTNILHYLYAFIRDIHFGIPENKGCVFAPRNIINSFCSSYIFKFNLLIIVLMASIFIYWRFFDENIKSSKVPIYNNKKQETNLYAKD